MYHTFFIHSFVHEYLGCFHILTTAEQSFWLAMESWRISRSVLLSRTDSLDKVSIVKSQKEYWSKDISMFILLIQVVNGLHIYKSYPAWFELLLLSI